MVNANKRVAKTIKIDPSIWKEMQHYCIDHDTDYSSFIENLIKEKLGRAK